MKSTMYTFISLMFDLLRSMQNIGFDMLHVHFAC